MSTIPTAPDFTILFAGYGNRCKHEALTPNAGNDSNIYHYVCLCGATFHKCAVDDVDGKLSLHDFSVKRGKRSARRRRP